jgi:hypothetical protein
VVVYLVIVDDPVDASAVVRALHADHSDIKNGLEGVEVGISVTLGLPSGVAYLTFVSDGETVYVDCDRETAAEFMEWFLRRIVRTGSVTVTDDNYSFDERIAAPSEIRVILESLPR